MLLPASCLDNFHSGGLVVTNEKGMRVRSTDVVVHPYLKAKGLADPTRVSGVLDLAVAYFPTGTAQATSPIARDFTMSIAGTVDKFLTPFVAPDIKISPTIAEADQAEASEAYGAGTPVHDESGSLLAVSRGCERGPDGKFACSAVSLHDTLTRELLETARAEHKEEMRAVAIPGTTHELGLFGLFNCGARRQVCVPARPVYVNCPQPQPTYVYVQPQPQVRYVAASYPQVAQAQAQSNANASAQSNPYQYSANTATQSQNNPYTSTQTNRQTFNNNPVNTNTNTNNVNPVFNNNPRITVSPVIVVKPQQGTGGATLDQNDRHQSPSYQAPRNEELAPAPVNYEATARRVRSASLQTPVVTRDDRAEVEAERSRLANERRSFEEQSARVAQLQAEIKRNESQVASERAAVASERSAIEAAQRKQAEERQELENANRALEVMRAQQKAEAEAQAAQLAKESAELKRIGEAQQAQLQKILSERAEYERERRERKAKLLNEKPPEDDVSAQFDDRLQPNRFSEGEMKTLLASSAIYDRKAPALNETNGLETLVAHAPESVNGESRREPVLVASQSLPLKNERPIMAISEGYNKGQLAQLAKGQPLDRERLVAHATLPFRLEGQVGSDGTGRPKLAVFTRKDHERAESAGILLVGVDQP
jgi:hypothetical protein